jgi:hypothetical protein
VNDRMTKLGQPQLPQQLNTAELDAVSIVRRELLVCQPNVNGFAGADEIRGLFTNIKHGGTPYEPEGQGVREGMRTLPEGPVENEISSTY